MPAAERTRLNDDTRELEGLCVNCTRDWRPIATAFLPRADSECMARRTRELTTALDEHRTALARGDDAQAKFDVVVAKRVQRARGAATCHATMGSGSTGADTHTSQRRVRGDTATGTQLAIERLKARQQQQCIDDEPSNTEFVSKLKRDRDEFKRNHPLSQPLSEATDAASKRQHVASPGQADTSVRPPLYELLVASPDGVVQSYPVDPAVPLRDTLLYHELPPGSRLLLDGDRLDTAQSVRALGLAHGAVLQACKPQTGGGYEKSDDFEAAMEVEREMEAEQQDGQSRRRQRVAAESEGDYGETIDGSGEAAPRRRRQRVAAESEDDEPIAESQQEEQEDAAGEAMGDARPHGNSGNAGNAGNAGDEHRSDDGADEGGAQPAGEPATPANEQQAQQRAQEASARAARFQQQQQQRVLAPDIASSGLEPLPGKQVEYAPRDASKVPDFGTMLKTQIQTLQAMRTGQTQLLPTASNTLLIEAGCAMEKTRKLIKWLREILAIDPDMPVLFVTTRQTHADDLAATLAWAKMVNTLEGMGFVNYRDGKASAATSQKDYLAGARRCIVSFEGLGSVDLELYRNGVVVMDEVRSLAAIPGGGTMEKAGQPSRTNPCVRALGMLCARAKYRVAMDADVSADGAVRDFLWSVAPQFDVLHVQLRQAALSREAHYGFTDSKRDRMIMRMRQRLALFRARESREKAMAGPEGQQLRQAALAVIRSWVKVKRRLAGEDPAELQLPFRDLAASVRDAPPNWKPVSVGMVRRKDGVAERDPLQSLRQLFQVNVAQMAMDAARKRFARLVERVFVIVGQRGQGSKVAAMANEIGAWTACEDDFYSGKGNDAVKRAHFKDTTRAWFWADVVIANSTLSVGVNVRIHFACCFLYTCASEQAPPLRVQLQGIVRVGRDEDDPLTDERIFVLIAGSAPTLDPDLTPQPQRHRRVLNELRAAAAEGRRAASAAKAAGDKRLDSPVQSVASESELSDKLLSLLAWSALEKADNCGWRHAIKLVELCKLPTRAWPVHLMEELSDAERAELDAFEEDLKENAATARLKTEDGCVGAMSTAKQYEWKLFQLQQAAVAKGTSLDYQRGEFIAYQEGLFVSKGARPEKDARAQADEAIYNVVRHLTPFDWSGAAWPAVEDYANVAHRIDAIVLRATLLHIPHDELAIVWEAQRRAGHAAHSEVVAPPHLVHKWLSEFASELGVSTNQLLQPTTFMPEQHEWLQCHNRLRAKMGEAGLQRRDAERRLCLYDLAKKLGAKKVTKQMTIVKIVAAVLRDVLALTPPLPLINDRACGPGEKKVPVEAAHGTFFQAVGAWAVEDEFALLVPEIQLDMLDPERRTIRRVRAADWETTFEHLTNHACGDEELGGMLSDAEEEDDGDAGLNGDGVGGDGGDSGVSLPHAPDPLLKSFQVDRARLNSVISECDHLAPAVAAAKAEIDARRSELHAASQGEGGGFSAAFVLLVHPTEPKVLMARECRDGYGTRRTGRGRRVAMREALNPLGGKRKGEETGRQTAAREAYEETAEHLSAASRRGICDGAPGVWAGDVTKSYVYVYRSPKGSDAGLHEKWRSVPATPTLKGVEWVPIEQLLDEAWCRQHCHDFSLEMIAAARPLLQQAATASAGVGPSGTHPDAVLHRRELKELDALYSHLARFEGFHSVARGFEMRCEAARASPDGWVDLADTYKQTIGRRYVESHGLPRVESEKRWQGAPPRTATLQGGHSDLRTVCCGARAHDIDCENGDYRLICSLATQTGNVDLVPTVFDYVAHREVYIKEICELHDCSEGTAKRLPNVVGNGGSYETWLRNNALRAPLGGLAAFNGKKCKAFLPPRQCKRGSEPNMTRELEALRTALFDHPRFRATVEAERGRLQREGLKPSWQHDASLWSTCVVQASENEVLGLIERALFGLGWDVWALIFDGLMAAPSAVCTEPDVKKAVAAAEAACMACRWDIKLADKDLHGLQDKTPKSIANARVALETWACRVDTAHDFDW